MRIVVVSDKRPLGRPSVHEAFDRRFTVKWVHGWLPRIPDLHDYQSYEAVLWLVRFRELERVPALEWGDYRGAKLLYDQDAWNLKMSMGFNPPNLQRPMTYRRHGFDWVLSTGKRISEELRAAGIEAVWWPKAYDQNVFFEEAQERRGLCHFGTLYVSRQAMLHRLGRAGIDVDHLTAPYDDLSHALNRYLGLLVCSLSNGTRTKLHRALRKLNAEWGLRLSSGPEPMLKLFEGSGSGCGVFNDYVDELADLGFKDGENIVTWHNFDELIDKIRWYSDRPEALRHIGHSSHLLCSRDHTWDHRMVQLELLVRAEPAARSALRLFGTSS